jgi:hypothetical protein
MRITSKYAAFVYILSLLLYLFACSKTKKQDLITLVEAAEKIIPLDSVSREGGYAQLIKVDGKYLLAKLNHDVRSIYFYDWESGKVIYKLPYKTDGPDGVGRLWGFYAVNTDSVYIISGSQYKVTLINAEGSVLRRYSLLPDKANYEDKSKPILATKENYTALPYLDIRHPAVKLDSFLVLSCVPAFRGDSEDFFRYGLVHLALNLHTGDMKYFMPYPELYINKGLLYPSQYSSTIFFTHNTSHSNIITSFPADNFIYITDINSGNMTSHLAQSKYIDKVAKMNKPSNEPADNSSVAFNNDHYHQIIYDQYRQYYLRMVWHPGPGSLFVRGGDNYSTMNIYTSIVVLDSAFNKIGEVEITEKGHNTAPVFITAEGMWLPFVSNSDDFMRFKLYKFNLNL